MESGETHVTPEPVRRAPNTLPFIQSNGLTWSLKGPLTASDTLLSTSGQLETQRVPTSDQQLHMRTARLPSSQGSSPWQDKQSPFLSLKCVKGVVRDSGHRTSFPGEPVCYLSLETIFNTFHSVLLVAEIAGARLVQVEGIC